MARTECPCASRQYAGSLGVLSCASAVWFHGHGKWPALSGRTRLDMMTAKRVWFACAALVALLAQGGHALKIKMEPYATECVTEGPASEGDRVCVRPPGRTTPPRLHLSGGVLPGAAAAPRSLRASPAPAPGGFCGCPEQSPPGACLAGAGVCLVSLRSLALGRLP
jgi:hypothetical protein